MLRRLFFTVFMLLGGFLLYPFKWILVGTKASRDRKKLLRLQAEEVRLLREAAREPPAGGTVSSE